MFEGISEDIMKIKVLKRCLNTMVILFLMAYIATPLIAQNQPQAKKRDPIHTGEGGDLNNRKVPVLRIAQQIPGEAREQMGP